MATKTLVSFDECKITDTHINQYDRSTGALSSDKAQRLGCTGKIEISSEYKTIVKNCEGVEEKSVKKITKLTGNISVHMPLAIARLVFGLSNKGLKSGVYGLSDTSSVPNMCLTSKAVDLFTDEEKYICLPNISITSGFAKVIDNTAEEIAEVSLEFNGYKDSNKEFYYEACASEIDAETIGNKWLENFTPELVKAVSE